MLRPQWWPQLPKPWQMESFAAGQAAGLGKFVESFVKALEVTDFGPSMTLSDEASHAR
jgi:hypothetical protein